ncbi:CIS tube protein [Dawidia soli]|nr:hypothetical protein [Dawidia soli]
MANGGKREKMIIEAYEAPDFTAKLADEYTFQINPEKYDRTREPSVREDHMRLANGDSVPTNKSIDREYLTLTFYVDATGAVGGCDDVEANIQALKKLCVDVNGNIHRANYLKVRWGADFTFSCETAELKTDFVLFKPDGTPVRAKVMAKFRQFTDADARAKQNNLSSPDLSHIKTIVDGDTLPVLCHRVYGDSKYYIQVAAYNKLINFNILTPGQRIIFPRLTND